MCAGRGRSERERKGTTSRGCMHCMPRARPVAGGPRWRRGRSEGRGPSHGASSWPLRYPLAPSPSPASSTKRLHNASSRSGRNRPQRRRRRMQTLPLPPITDPRYHASMHVPPLHLAHLGLVWTLRTPPYGLCTAMARGTGQVSCKQSVPTATKSKQRRRARGGSWQGTKTRGPCLCNAI